MNNKVIRRTVLELMKYLNLSMVIFLSVITYVSLEKISNSMHARDFLQGIEHMPPVPGVVPIFSIGGCVCLLISMDLKYMNVPLWICNILQIGVGLIIVIALQMNYNGIILLVAAQLLGNFKEQKEKLAFFACIGVFLLAFDFNLCEKFFDITSFETCIQYYRNMTASILLVCKNLGTSINTILFIVYTILLLREQIDETEKVEELNAQLNQANIELQIANSELENYARESEQMAQTRERNRLAREIHDTLGHTLTGIIAGLDAAVAMLNISPESTGEQLKMIGDVARQGMTDVRRSVNELRPDVLDRKDLLTALEETIKRMATASKVDIVFTNEVEKLKFSEDEEDIIYRVIQESITNSIRHGKATKIDVYMRKDYSIVTIRIKDNGIGAKEIKYGFGITHMKERLEMIKGDLHVESNDGFLVEAKIPIRWGEEND